jgi:hypothetical protein
MRKELETVFKRRLRKADLSKIGSVVAPLIGLSLPSEAKRAQAALLGWFTVHRVSVLQKVAESNLAATLFTENDQR